MRSAARRCFPTALFQWGYLSIPRQAAQLSQAIRVRMSTMRRPRLLLLMLLLVLAGSLFAQQGRPPIDPLQWTPPELGALSQSAALHTDLTFDRRMLELAGGLWEGGGDPGVTQAIDKLNGLTVHNYHYAHPGMYDPRLVDGVRHAYGALGWEHLVLAGNREDAAGTYRAPDRGAIDRSAAEHGATDLWIRFEHLQVTGAVVLFQSPGNVALIAVSGNLSPIDLLHLRGHFGIPRFAGDRFQPQP